MRTEKEKREKRKEKREKRKEKREKRKEKRDKEKKEGLFLGDFQCPFVVGFRP